MANQYQILPAHEEDIPTLARIFQQAFAANPEFEVMYREVKPEDIWAHDAEGYVKEFRKPGAKWWKAVEVGSGETVAFSTWRYPHDQGPDAPDPEPRTWPPNTIVPLAEDFLGRMYSLRSQNWNSSCEYFVHILAVLPSHQRQGLGRRLLEEGMEAADRDGARTYIEASQNGFPLYKRLGWVEFDAVVVDTMPFGGRGLEPTRLMWREPGAGRVKN